MRISKATVTADNEITVIRGALGTRVETHDNGSLARKIKPIPIEFRRPSVLRASGHTFEYLGYGPGNYSTALPQLQTVSLTEKEEFLSQAQEKSAGAVVYTGMNDKGDFYIGNQKKSSLTGEETTFDTPVPTVTGEDAGRLSVVFDEVTVKERLIVEGGDNSQVLSQFDGPATFNNEVRIKSTLDVSSKTKFNNTSEATSSTDAAVVFSGGVGINSHSQLPDDAQLRFGNSSDLAIYHDSENSFIKDSGTGSLILNSNQLEIKNAANSAVGLKYQEGSSIELYHGGTKQFETSSKGVQVGSGVTIETNGQATFIGVVTATSFSGPVLGDITGNIIGNVTGNADTAGKADGLTTSRTIGGVSFDGSANIDLPGVNVSGNQDTTGTATNASNVQVGTLGDSVGPHFIFMKTGSSSEFAEPKVDAGISYNSLTNTLSVAGDVIAFASDDRLKTDKLLIDNPLDKVMQIEGFTFNFNEIGSKIFDTSVRHVGVSAQQIQKVLPEAVASAPMNLIDNEDYLTVKYDKLVPLLIEAIKELNKKVEKLEQKLSDK